MKKSLLIAVLALTMLMAMTAIAYAEVATTGNFQGWTSGGVNGVTPHIGFATTSVKCAVCHSVHNADQVATTAGEVLLRSSVANSCTYCHVSGTGVSLNRPYGTTLTNYTSDSVFNHASTSTVLTTYQGCSSCHSVHGADTYQAAGLQAAILRHGSPVAGAGWDTGSESQQLTAFCTQCHAYYTTAYDTSTTAGNHIMTSAFTNYANPARSTSALQVAAAGSTYCTSCHDAARAGGNGNSFPHLMPNNARFVRAYSSLAGTEAATVPNASVDGACLKCHKWGTNGVDGVGVQF